MTILSFNKLYFKTSILLVFFCAIINSTAFGGYKKYHNLDQQNSSLTDTIDGVYKALKINDTQNDTQTIAYLNKNLLRKNVTDTYRFKLERIGKEFFQNLLKTCIERELKYAKNYRAFYHGQDRVFMLFQDIYDGLYKIAYKKTLNDFLMLRVPDKSFGKFKSVNDFLHDCIKNNDFACHTFDHKEHIKKQLLAVNPSLFGNTLDPGESTFRYFLNSSNISEINISKLIENVFSIFGFDKYFVQYQTTLTELNTLLKSGEQEKTGLLLQIFIPNNLVNTLAYRCKPFGTLFHNNKNPELHPASKDLDDYRRGTIGATDKTLDETQFRLLINEVMLNPTSGVKMFRYYNETDAMKKYNKILARLFSDITRDVARATSSPRSPSTRARA